MGFVRVGFTCVDVEFAVLCAAERVFGEHAPDGAFDEEDGTALADLARGLDFFAADVAGETGVDFGAFLGAGEDDLIGVDDDDIVTGVNVGGENGLVFATEEAGGLDCDLAEDLAFGIDHVPFAIHFMRLGGKRLHVLDRNAFERR